MPTLNAPALNGQTLSAPTFTQQKTLYAPAYEGQVLRAPSIGQTAATGLLVKVGATTLTEAHKRQWIDSLDDAGFWEFSLDNSDANMPAFDDVVTFELDGEVRFSGPVRSKQVTTLDPGEGQEKVTVLSGPGRLGITDKSVLAPSRGWDAEPVETTRTQSWVSPDYDDSAWPYVKRMRLASTPTPFNPSRAIPDWWPDKTAWWVAPNRSDVTGTLAPFGSWPIRSDPISLSEGTIAILFGADNRGPVYFDGAMIADLNNSPGDGNQVRIEVSTGNHELAARVTNYIRTTGFIASIYTVDNDGLLDTLVWSSDSDNMRALAYPDPFPGMNAGVAIRQFLEEVQADGELQDMVLDFTDLVDSDGQPWTTVPEITSDVGRSFYEYVLALSDWLIDVHMAPGSDTLRAWNWGTRGGTPGVTIAATSDATTSEVERLTFSGRHIRANRLKIRYRRGYTEVNLAGEDPTVTAFLDLHEVDSESAAQSIGTNLLELRKDPSYAGSLALSPVSSVPYEDFDNGDTVTHPADPGGSTTSRVRSMAYAETDEGERTWHLELHDVRRSNEERQENWLKRAAMGSLAGGARVTSKTGDSIRPAERVLTKDVAEFSYDNVALAVSDSPKRPAAVTGNLIEIRAELTTAGSTSSTVRVYKNGVQLGSDLTFAAGVTVAEVDLEAEKTYRNLDIYQTRIITAGTGAAGLDVQVRAI